MSKLAKYSNFIMILLLAVSAIVGIFFYAGGEIEGELHTTPVYTETLLNWTYLLTGITLVLALVFPIIDIIRDPKTGLKTIGGVVVMLVIFLMGYAMADDVVLKIPGYEGVDNVPGTLKIAGTFLYSTYIIIGLAFATAVFAEVRRMFH